MQVDKDGNQMYDVDGSPLLDISDEHSKREAEEFRAFLAEAEKKSPGISEVLRNALTEEVRADEITEATLERIRKSTRDT